MNGSKRYRWRGLAAAWLALVGLAMVGLAVVGTAHADEVVVVCPPALQRTLLPWVVHRRAGGHEVTVVDRVQAAPLPRRSGASRGQPRRMLLLVGDGVRAGLPPRQVPARVIRRYGPEATIATDTCWRDSIGADVVARLPFNDQASLAEYVQRLIEREQRPATLADTRLQLTAGVGGFSPMIDAAIEGAGKRIVGGLAPLASEISLHRVDQGEGVPAAVPSQRGGVWVWLGHGQRHALPGVSPSNLVQTAGGADIAVLLACYAGDYTATGHCVAEQLLHDTKGPLVVIASTRVSMPYGNARLGGELLAAMSRSPRASIGGLWGEALSRSTRTTEEPLLASLDPLAHLLSGDASLLDAERGEHADMYGLLGDPLTIVDRNETLLIQVPTPGRWGEPLFIEGDASGPGQLRIEIRRRQSSGSRSPSQPLVSESTVHAAGAFRIPVELPHEGRAGERLVHASLTTERGVSVGAALVRLESSRDATGGDATGL